MTYEEFYRECEKHCFEDSYRDYPNPIINKLTDDELDEFIKKEQLKYPPIKKAND